MAAESGEAQALAHNQAALKLAFENDSLTNLNIFDSFGAVMGMSFDDIQRARKEYRQLNGLPPLKRGPKSPKPRALDTSTEALREPAPTIVVLKFDDEQLNRIISALSSRKD